MDKIKNKGLATLIKEGQFDFYGADIEACSCLSDDLSLEEINATMSTAEDMLSKMPSAIEKLKKIGDRYNSLFFEVEEKEEVKKASTESRRSIQIILGVGLTIFGAILVIPKAMLGLTSSAATTWMWWGIGCIVPGILLLSLAPNETTSNNKIENQKTKQATEENEEMKYLQSERDSIYTTIGVCTECDYFEWESPAINLATRLPILVSWLKKMKVIQEDKTLNPSAKMLALAQLFSLLNNEISNAKILKEKQRQSLVMEKQLKEMKKQARELETQNDMLTLQTYNKVSEMEGHDPDIVAAQTYAQMSRIQKERNKED